VSAQKGEVETILRSDAFSANTLRDLVDEKNLDVNKLRTEDMINALLRYSWSDDEIEELKDRLEELQRENQTMGYYVAELDGLPNTTQQPQHKELREALLIDEADRTDDEIEQKGFEVQSVSSGNLTAIYWTQTKKLGDRLTWQPHFTPAYLRHRGRFLLKRRARPPVRR